MDRERKVDRVLRHRESSSRTRSGLQIAVVTVAGAVVAE
jgi:hypothetical protein